VHNSFTQSESQETLLASTSYQQQTHRQDLEEVFVFIILKHLYNQAELLTFIFIKTKEFLALLNTFT